MAQNKQKDLSYVNDFQTPPNVCRYMADILSGGVVTVLEPTPGIGNLVKALENKGFSVTAPENYWVIDKTKRFDAIAANLPFSSKTFFNCPVEFANKGMITSYEQIKVLMGMSNILVLLVPWFTISDSDVRLRMIKDFGLVSITVLPRKTFQYARIQTCIIHLEKGYLGLTEFKVFDRLKTEQYADFSN